MECEHINVFNGICSECRMCMSSSGMTIDLKDDYSTSNQKYVISNVSKIRSNFDKELRDKAIPDNVKAWVLHNVSFEIMNNRKVICKQKNIYAYVYLAYLSLNYEIDTKELADILGMKRDLIKQSIKLASGISSSILPQSNTVTCPMVITSPPYYLSAYLEKLGLESREHDIRAWMKQKLDENMLLYEEKPDIMCIALIKQFFDEINEPQPIKYHLVFKIKKKILENHVAMINGIEILEIEESDI